MVTGDPEADLILEEVIEREELGVVAVCIELEQLPQVKTIRTSAERIAKGLRRVPPRNSTKANAMLPVAIAYSNRGWAEVALAMITEGP